MIMASGQMGAFNLEKNGCFLLNSCRNPSLIYQFSISPKPCFASNSKTADGLWVLYRRTPSCRMTNALPKKEFEGRSSDGGFLEKEFKFEPLFDEYIKVMESVSTRRDKKLNQNANKHCLDKNLPGKDVAGNGEKDDLGGPEWNHRRVKNENTVEKGEVGKNKKIWISDGKTHQRGDWPEKDNGVNRIPGRWRMDFGESNVNLKDNRILELYENYNDIKGETDDGDLEKKQEYNAKYPQVQKPWQQNGRSIKNKIGESGTGGSMNMEDVKGTGSKWTTAMVRRDKSNSYENSTEVHMKQTIQNRTWQKGKVGNVEIKIDDSDNMMGMSKREKFHSTKFETVTGESNINMSMYEEQSFDKMDVQRKMLRSETDDRKLEEQKFHRSNVEEKMDETEPNKHKSQWESYCRRIYGRKPQSISRNGEGMPYLIEKNGENQSKYAGDTGNEFCDQYRSQGHTRLPDYSAEDERKGCGGTQMSQRLSKNYVYSVKGGGYKISQDHEKVAGPSHAFMDDENENDFDMERKAFKTFEVFTDVRGRPRVLRMEMEERIQKLARWLNSTDVDMPEWQFSKMMHSAQIRFTDHSILRVVQILGSLGNWRRVLQVVQWLQSHDRFKSYKSKYIYTTVLNVLGKAKRPVEALNVFHAMRQQFSSYPDLAAYHCIAVTLGQAGHMQELFDVIDCMRALPQKKFKTGMLEKWDPRLEPDDVVYNAVLNACVRQKQWEGAFWVLQQLKQQRIQPSSTTYGLVMEVMFACGKYSLVHEFFRKVEKTTIPSALNYRVLVNTLWREGKTDEALLAVGHMERRGIVGSASLYYDLARCLCSAGRCQEALKQIEKICKVAKKPLVVTYTGLIQACLESGSVLNATYIFNQMHEFCSPNIVTCNIMIKAYVENKMFEEANGLFQKILDGTHHINSVSDYKNRIVPDNFTFNTMLEACVSEKRWDDFENVYQRMLQHGYHFNPKRHLCMILEASRAGKGQPLDATWDHLVRTGRTVPLPIFKERFCMKLQEDELAPALSCILSDRMSGPHTLSEKTLLDLLNSNAHRFQEDTLLRLVHEINHLVSEYDQSKPIYQNLISSCREFIRTHNLSKISL